MCPVLIQGEWRHDFNALICRAQCQRLRTKKEGIHNASSRKAAVRDPYKKYLLEDIHLVVYHAYVLIKRIRRVK